MSIDFQSRQKVRRILDTFRPSMVVVIATASVGLLASCSPADTHTTPNVTPSDTVEEDVGKKYTVIQDPMLSDGPVLCEEGVAQSAPPIAKAPRLRGGIGIWSNMNLRGMIYFGVTIL